METSSDSDTTDEWIVLDDDDAAETENLIKDQTSHEDDVSQCVGCPDICGVSDARTTSLGFTEEGNPPDNGEVPPAEDIEVHDVQNVVEQAEDLSDLSSYTKEELPENIDMTPAVRHYVHKKNVNLNSLLNIYLALAVIAAMALGFGNFLGWSYCSSLKGVLQKQEQMLEQLQNKLSDCNSHLNASHLLASDSGPTKHSRPAEEVKHEEKNSENNIFPQEKNQKKTGEHWPFIDEKNLWNLIHYPLLALESRSDMPSFMKSVDQPGQTGLLRHVLDFQNMKPDVVNIKSSAEQLGKSQGRKESVAEFVTHKAVDSPFPNLGLHSGRMPVVGYKETLSTTSLLSDQWKESQMNLKFPDLYLGKHFSDVANVLDMSHFNIAFPQKKGVESQENFHSGSYLPVDRVSNLESSEIPNLGIKSDQLDLEDPVVQHYPKDTNYHAAHLISSVNNIMSLQKIQNIREDHVKSNLNVTQAVFQELLENLREKLEDIKNFTLSPLFVKHSHYSQKAVNKLLKVFDSFMGRFLKYSDNFFQKNIHGGNKVGKLTGKMLSCMNKLNCKWQKIKDKWQHLIQHEHSSKNVDYKENRCQFGQCSKQRFESHTQKCEEDKPSHPECLIKNELFGEREKEQVKDKSDSHTVTEYQKAVKCLRKVYFGGEATEQVKEKSDYQRAVEQLIKEEFLRGGKLNYQRIAFDVMEDKFFDGRMEILKDKGILEVLGNIYFNEIPKEQVKSKSDYQTVLRNLRNMYFSKKAKEQGKGKLNYQKILELLRSMYFGDMAVKQTIDTTNYFRTVECLLNNNFSGGKVNKLVKVRSDYHRIIKHQKTSKLFRDMDFEGGAKHEIKRKSGDKRPADHIAEDEFSDGTSKGKREDRSSYLKTVEHHMKHEFSGREAKRVRKEESDVQKTIEHLIRFAGKAEKQLKDMSGYKKHLEYFVKDEFFGERANGKVRNRYKSQEREQNYKRKNDAFEKKIKNGKFQDYNPNYDKMNKREKHINLDFKKSEKILRYKEDNRRDFMNSEKASGKSINWGKN